MIRKKLKNAMASIGLPVLDVYDFLLKICVIFLENLKIIKKSFRIQLALTNGFLSN